MKDIDDEIHVVNEIAKNADVPAVVEQARLLSTTDPMDEMRDEMLGFLKNRISSITRAEKIKELTYQSLEENITSGELSVEQKLAILMRISRDNNDLTESIISMLRPVSNGGSLLSDMMRPQEDKSEITKAFENYSSEDLRKIDDTFRTIRDIVEAGGGTVSVSTPDGSEIPTSEV